MYAAAGADGKPLKTKHMLSDSMTGVAVYFQNVTPPSLVSKLSRHVIAYPYSLSQNWKIGLKNSGFENHIK